jgi:uncharacterized protein
MWAKRLGYRLRIGVAVLVGAGLAFPVLDQFTHHHGETVILLMPPMLGVLLWWGWPRVRRVRWWQLALYVLMLGLVITGAEALAAHMARGRLLGMEVFWAVYFAAGWRLAWEVWRRTSGRLGEVHRRWGCRLRRSSGGWSRILDPGRRRAALLSALVGPVRFCLVLFVFAPLFAGSLVHRVKIGNPVDLGDHADLPIETMKFTTDDGVALSGWFLPEAGSDTTVVICHGAGANKGNFIDFISLFTGRGYSSLIFDARGHGDSAGHTSTFGLFETADVRAAVDWLKSQRPEYARHVVGLGSSMGAMTLVRAAAGDDRIEAVVLDSCFVSAPLLAKQHARRVPVIGPVLADLVLASMSLHAGRSLWDLDASDAIRGLSPRPILLIHGTEDFVIPPVNLDLLYNIAGAPKNRWLGPGPHSNIMTTDFYEYQRRVLALFDAVRAAPDGESVR